MKCGTRIIVSDNDFNRKNEFWKACIGKHGTFVCEEMDGMWAVTLDDLGVVDGVQPARFLPLDLVVPKRPWWKRLLGFINPIKRPWWKRLLGIGKP